jgi:thiamine-monophosphate kinase
MNEQEWIKRLRPLSASFLGAENLMDDVAYVPAPQGEYAITTDQVVSGVHFFHHDAPDSVATKLIARNRSDLIAKGARPEWMVMNLALPKEGLPKEWLTHLLAALTKQCNDHQLALIGGDSCGHSYSRTWILGATMGGRLLANRRIRRSDAKNGDQVYLLGGVIGDSYLGLQLCQERWDLGNLPIDAKAIAALKQAYYYPKVMGEIAAIIAQYAHSSIDISDGLAKDAAHIAKASELCLVLDRHAILHSCYARNFLDNKLIYQDELLTGGDDYVVLCTVPSCHQMLLEQSCKASNIACYCIGFVRAKGSATEDVYWHQAGQSMPLKNAQSDGFSHSW